MNIINEDKKYYTDSIKKWKDILNKSDDDINKEKEITEIGMIAADYYTKRVKILNENKNALNQRVLNDFAKPDDDEKKSSFHININESMYSDICDDINSFICLSDQNQNNQS